MVKTCKSANVFDKIMMQPLLLVLSIYFAKSATCGTLINLSRGVNYDVKSKSIMWWWELCLGNHEWSGSRSEFYVITIAINRRNTTLDSDPPT